MNISDNSKLQSFSYRDGKTFGGETGKEHVSGEDTVIKGERASSLALVEEKLRSLRKDILSRSGNSSEASGPGQSPSTGSRDENTVRIGTFNIAWLGGEKFIGKSPRSEQDYKDIAGIINDSGSQIVGLQEIFDDEPLKRLQKYLPDFDYVIGASGVRADGSAQRLALIYDRNRVSIDRQKVSELRQVQLPDIMGDDHLRAPLVIEDVKADNFDFTLVVCHLKSAFDDHSLKVRHAQADRLNEWIKSYLSTHRDKDLMVIGDLNDMIGSDTLNRVAAGNVLHFVTEENAKKGEYTNIPHKSLIDHQAVSDVEGGAREEYIFGSSAIPMTKNLKGYTKRISDHRIEVCDYESGVDRDP